MTKRARKWKMFARVYRNHGEDNLPELSFSARGFHYMTRRDEQIIRVLVTELPRKARK